MNPKWILVILAVLFAYGVIRKISAPNSTPNSAQSSISSTSASVDATSNTDQPPRAKATPSRPSWPPVIEGGVAAASPTVNYYVILDGSGSMSRRECADNGRKIEVAIDAVQRFVSEIPSSANVGLAVFDRRDLSERVPIGADNREAISEALTRVRAGEGTPLKSAIRLGYEKLTAQASAQLGYGEYHLVVVTDGKPDPEDEDPTRQVKEILARSPVVLHTIGFCIDPNHVLNQPGRVYYAAASNPDELQKGLQAVLAESTSFDATTFAR